MKKEAEIIVLGCGNSTGVPAIGNYWGDCDPKEPKNIRTRSSIAIKTENTTIVIDTGPDFRQQMNRENIAKLDAVLFTHQHNDHVMGIDELRVLKFRNKMENIPIYGNLDTIEDLEQRFLYLFKGGDHKLYPPILESNIIPIDAYNKTNRIGDIHFKPFEQDHGSCKTIGYRFGQFAYSVDILDLDQNAIDALKGIKTWLVDCAAYKDNQNAVHAGIDKIMKLNKEIKAEHVILTSLSLSADYQSLTKELPNGYLPAYDGLRIKETISK
ncbi:MAG: MBL fold metallo-hydrolase [Bdellovibrionales bacterium]